MANHVLTAFLVIGIVFSLCGLVLLYFGSRLQLVFMELVANRETVIGPSWRRQGSKAWRWIGLKIACLLTTFLLIGTIAALPILYFVRSMPSNPRQPPNAAFFGSFFLFFITIGFAVLLFMLALWTLRDFVMPFIVFEDATMLTALRNAVSLIRHETGSVLFYLLMKIVFTMAAGLAAELCFFIGALAAAIPLGAFGTLTWFALHRGDSAHSLVLYVLLGILGTIFIAWMFVVGVCVMGCVLIFYQAYTLYFLGGRIPSIGSLLEPPPPPLMGETASPFVPA